MLLKRNLLETVTIISCSGSLICILLNYVTNISPIQGIWFPIYFLFLFIVSVTFSFKLIQWLLHLNKPLKYDFERLIEDYPSLEFLLNILPRAPKTKTEECKEYDTNELSVISTVLERRLVSSWYTHYVSQEIGFPFACKQMLDQMIGRTFQICNKIETKDVYVDICSVLITHLKEYKKAIKRHEKSPNQPIETLYKKSHKIFDTDKTYQSAEHCTNLLRIILKELVPWELWDTPHSELLIRILSKKLDNFIDNTLADPVWINDRLMTLLKGKKPAPTPDQNPPQTESTEKVIPDEELKLIQDVIEIPKEIEIPLVEPEPKIATPTIESALSALVTKTTAPILQRAIDDDFDSLSVEDVDQEGEEAAVGTESLDIKSSPVLRQRRGRQGRNEVKIYDRIIEGSVKTWETDNDLQCISMGQDLLASLNGEITLSRLWGQDPPDSEVGKESRLWFGEDDALEMDAESKELSPVKKEHSPKPTEVLLKDLQTTVHQAKTKIGDLQVPQNVLDVPTNDEAAGMMEGLLDFGIAGLKKGLRFTGLSDDAQEKSPSHKDKEKPEKSPPPDSKHKSSELSLTKDTGISSVLQKEENGSNSAPPLVKQQRVSSQDSVASLPRAVTRGAPPPLQPLPDSPEPEYEEAADLSTSIAKLRCLLQQRAEAHVHSHSSKAEDIWWEGAEETRGRTQYHPSSRPVDTAAFADEYDMNTEKGSSPGHTSNNMQRLDKLFQRTVTGVFNSIKTAVGAEGEAEGAPSATHDWAYVCTSIELSVGGAVARLVGSRRAFSHVDAALDSLEQLAVPPAPPAADLVPDDFEEWCAARGAGWCAGAELAAAAGLCGSHLTYRVATLMFADLAESVISVHLKAVSSWLRRQVFAVFERMDQQEEREEPRGVYRQEDVAQPLLDKFPALEIFGEEAVRRAVDLVVRSLSHKAVNKDVIFRVLDLYTVHFKQAAGQRNPSFDAN